MDRMRNTPILEGRVKKKSEKGLQDTGMPQSMDDKLRLGLLDRIAILLAVWRTVLPWGLLMAGLFYLLFLMMDALMASAH